MEKVHIQCPTSIWGSHTRLQISPTTKAKGNLCSPVQFHTTGEPYAWRQQLSTAASGMHCRGLRNVTSSSLICPSPAWLSFLEHLYLLLSCSTLSSTLIHLQATSHIPLPNFTSDNYPNSHFQVPHASSKPSLFPH